MDLNVLEGGINTIKRCQPSIYIEVTNKTISDITDFLKRQGYNLYLVQDDDHLMNDLGDDHHIRWGNILAVIPEKRHLLRQFISNQ